MRDNSEIIRAGFVPRLAAWLIDRLIVVIGLVPVHSVFSALGLFTGIFSANFVFQYSVENILCWTAGCAYFTLLTRYSGSTLGKKLLHLEVIAEPGTHLRFIDILYRETVGRFLSSLLFVGYLMALFSPSHRALHDRLCDTTVVYKTEYFRRKQPEDPLQQAPEARTADEMITI